MFPNGNISKPQILGNKNISEKSLIAILRKTWLETNVLHAEVAISYYTIIRGDRLNRIRGGAALYIRSDLYPMKFSSF